MQFIVMKTEVAQIVFFEILDDTCAGLNKSKDMENGFDSGWFTRNKIYKSKG